MVTEKLILRIYQNSHCIFLGDLNFTEVQIKAADINGDGETEFTDLAHLNQFLSKKTDKLD